MMSLAVAFTGPSGSGKTTTIEKIANILTKDYAVSIVKHDPADKARFDKEGKDSDRFYKTGADVAVISPTRTTLFSHKPSEIEKVVDLFGEFDFLLVEGLKTLPLPRIYIARKEIDLNYIPSSSAIATDESVDLSKYDLPKDLDILDLNDTDEIINWIKQNAKKVRK